MDMFDKLDAVDTIKFSGLDSDGWYIDSARKALESGRMLYAGKYSKPDYELLVSENRSLAIENTMITHSPQVTEKLKSFDIPSIIEYSSYEEEPLGRVEWVKFFGALTDRDEKADELFNEQVDIDKSHREDRYCCKMMIADRQLHFSISRPMDRFRCAKAQIMCQR